MNRLSKSLLGSAFLTTTWISIPQELPGQTLSKATDTCEVHSHGKAAAIHHGAIADLNNGFRVTSGAGVRFAGLQGCSQRVGPFAGQDAAWRRWREAQAAGYSVSSGIFKCYDGELGEGWCFNVFYPC